MAEGWGQELSGIKGAMNSAIKPRHITLMCVPEKDAEYNFSTTFKNMRFGPQCFGLNLRSYDCYERGKEFDQNHGL